MIAITTVTHSDTREHFCFVIVKRIWFASLARPNTFRFLMKRVKQTVTINDSSSLSMYSYSSECSRAGARRGAAQRRAVALTHPDCVCVCGGGGVVVSVTHSLLSPNKTFHSRLQSTQPSPPGHTTQRRCVPRPPPSCTVAISANHNQWSPFLTGLTRSFVINETYKTEPLECSILYPLKTVSYKSLGGGGLSINDRL